MHSSPNGTPAPADPAKMMESELPPVVTVPPTTISHAYGAVADAAAYGGLSRTPAHFRGLWQHGWFMQPLMFGAPALFGVSLKSHPPAKPLWVARKDEEQYLRSLGYEQAHAIGLPIVYTPDLKVERLPQSLLVMPIHSLDYLQISQDFASYLELIASMQKEFSRVVVCIHPSCWARGNLRATCERLGLETVKGAGFDDRNALRRMQYLMCRFEFMTTNGHGSHLAYAAYYGAKPSIFGGYVAPLAKDRTNTPFYSEHRELLGPTIAALSEPAYRSTFPWMFVDHPKKATQQVEWGREQVGISNRRDKGELRRLFGWTFRRRAADRYYATIYPWVARLTPPIVLNLARRVLRRKKRPQPNEFERIMQQPPFSQGETTLFGPPFKFVHPQSFVYQYQSIVQRELYRFPTTEKAPYIIDGGANVGVATAYFKRAYPASRVIAFEADPQVFKLLEHNCKSLGLDDVELVNKALWSSEGSLHFLPDGADAGRLEAGGLDRGIKVPTVPLRRYIEGQSVQFLKLDVEGAELELLRSCADLLSNVENMFVEYHSYFGREQEMVELFDILKRAGFRLHLQNDLPADQPFIYRPVNAGLDHVVHVFAYRE